MRKVVVQNNSQPSEKKSRSLMPSFLKTKRRLSTHNLSKGERIIDPSHEKYDPEANLGNEQVISALAAESEDIDPFENDSRPRNSSGLFGNRRSEGNNNETKRDSLGNNTPKEKNGPRRSTLRRDSLAPDIRDSLDRRVEDALLTSLDVPSYSGSGTIADLRLTPAYSVALKANEDALIATANILGDDHPEVIQRKLSTADIYKGLGMMREAADLLQEIVDCQRKLKLNNEINIQLLMTLNELALIYTTLGRHNDAENLFQEVINSLSKLSDLQPDTAIALGNLAIGFRKSRQFQKAIPAHDRAVKIMSTILGKENHETIYQRAQYAVTLIHSGDEIKGMQMLQEALQQMEKLGLRSDHIWVRMFKPELKNVGRRVGDSLL